MRRKPETEDVFPISITQEIKGLAIFTIVFSHIGYFLVSDHRFLFPLSVMAGVGVDLFFFMAGYGLTMSALKKGISASEFYRRHLLKIFTPFWITLFAFFILDSLFLKINYPWQYMIQSAIGSFPTADLFRDINSPLWYFTPILFYYLIFPLLFSKKRPWISAGIIYALSYSIIKLNPGILGGVMHLYEVHYVAFPLGMIFASLISNLDYFNRLIPDKFKKAANLFGKPAYYLILIFLTALISYTAYYSGVGTSADNVRFISMITTFAIIILFLLKKLEIRLFTLFGVYSYEIYLIHWPILSRYDVFYKYLPGWLSTIFYLALFLLLARGLKILSEKILKK
jgi:peptidoglycan/LPS O-acetylase OafA/YrhL